MAHQRHKPEDTALHKLVRENLWDFLGRALEQTGKRMPSFVVEAWRLVLSLPFELWGLLGYRTKLMNRVQVLFVDIVQRWYEERAREAGFLDGKTGGVLFLHRFNSSLGRMRHLHAVVVDGIYTPDGVFHRPAAPDKNALTALCTRLCTRTYRMLERCACGPLHGTGVPEDRARTVRASVFTGSSSAGRAQRPCPRG